MTKFLKLTCLVSIILIAGCTKDKTQQIKEQSAETQKWVNTGGITFSPESALYGSAITINGSFSTTPGANVVKINGVTGIINSVAADKIVVTVPVTATTGKISVTANSVTTTSAIDFKVLKLVNEGSRTFPIPITNLSFDRSGNGVTYSLGGADIYKTTSAGIGTKLYSIPPQELVSAGRIYYLIMGIDNDGLGNVYVIRNRYRDSSYTIPGGMGVNTETRVQSSVVLKINAAGQVSTLLGDGAGPKFYNLTDLMIDAKGQSIILYNAKFNTYENNEEFVTKVSRSGNVQNLNVPLPTYFFNDKDDNYYTIPGQGKTDAGKLFKVSSAGVVTFISGKGGLGNKNGPANEATFGDGPAGLIVDGLKNVLLFYPYSAFRVVNTAGYASTLPVALPETSGKDVMFFNRFTNKIYIIGASQSGALIHQYAIK
ncbi:MAG: hypothetical protein EOP47_13480 [Sphingobacteriaceae bacterium]|nr:MAG: hypothetical protein EOP47_13480 [Sphingobacteriaceae bacterium]